MIKAKKICKLGQYKISGEIEMLWMGCVSVSQVCGRARRVSRATCDERPVRVRGKSRINK